MSAGGPDLFVICKNCQAEVSPYITECPYCGNRLRKRAPKLDRNGRVSERRRARRSPPPLLTRLRPGEIPGIRPDVRPYATIALVLAGLAGTLLWRTGLGAANLQLDASVQTHWWRLVTAPFGYDNTGYAFLTLAAVALFGWLLERRHGPVLVLGLFAAGAVGGMAATEAVYQAPFAMGANGAALALIFAWAVPDLLALRSSRDVDGDLIGAAVAAAVIAIMPLAVQSASWVADGVGVLAGLAAGIPLARFARR